MRLEQLAEIVSETYLTFFEDLEEKDFTVGEVLVATQSLIRGISEYAEDLILQQSTETVELNS